MQLSLVPWFDSYTTKKKRASDLPCRGGPYLQGVQVWVVRNGGWRSDTATKRLKIELSRFCCVAIRMFKEACCVVMEESF